MDAFIVGIRSLIENKGDFDRGFAVLEFIGEGARENRLIGTIGVWYMNRLHLMGADLPY